jgi:hypothetical protein
METPIKNPAALPAGEQPIRSVFKYPAKHSSSTGIDTATGRLVQVIDPHAEPCPYRWRCCDVFGREVWFQPRKGVKIALISCDDGAEMTMETCLLPGDHVMPEGVEIRLSERFPVPPDDKNASPVPTVQPPKPLSKPPANTPSKASSFGGFFQ